MDNLTLELYHLPPSELFPNILRRLHWSKRSAVEKVARDEVGWLAKSMWEGPPLKHAKISYTFVVKDKRVRDLDNLLSATKPFTDGLVDADVLEADDMAHLQYGKIVGVYGKEYKTIIRVEKVDEQSPE